jgi:ligand-binding sensor domain-containing protein
MNMQRMWLWICAMALTAVTVRAQHYPILPVPNSPHGVYTLFQDSRSALWLGTVNDVLRFDGEHFYSLRPYGFPREVPVSFAEDSDGGIWIATQGTAAVGGTRGGGLYRYQAGRVTRMIEGDAMTVVSLAPGVVVASMGTEIGGRPAFGDLYLLRKPQSDSARQPGKWTAQLLLQKQANHLTLDHHGNLLFPCPGGWCQIDHAQLVQTQVSLSVAHHAGSPLIQRVLRDRFGCIWLRAEQFVSYQCSTDAEPQTLPANIAANDSGAELQETSDGSIFLTNPLGLLRPGSFRLANLQNGVPKALDTAMVAADGTIWIGTENGLFRFMHPFQIESWGSEDGVEVTTTTALSSLGEDIFATAGKNGGVLRFDKARKQWSLVAGSEGLSGDLAAGPDGSLLVATASRLVQLHPTGGVQATLAIPDSTTFSLASAQDGELWLAHGGIGRIATSANRLALHPESAVEGELQATGFAYDQARRTLWACDGNDLLFHKNGNWGRIASKDGLPSLRCGAIAIQSNGGLWVGHDGGVLSWIGDPASGHPVVHTYSPWQNQSVDNNFTHFLSADSRGWLWMGKESLYLSTLDAAKSPNWVRLDSQDGVAPTLNRSHSFLEAPDGSVWFATTTGLTHILPPQGFASSFPPPPVFVAGLSLGQGADTPADTIGTIQRNADVVAHLGSLQFDRRNALHIRYRLLPGQTAWVPASNLNLPLGKLSWGHHTLEVQAQLATGPWSPVTGQVLDVPWPIWLSWPVLLLYGAGATGLGLGAMQWRKRQRLNDELSLPDLSTWRMRALSPETEPLIGTVIDGRYEIGHILSVGGFATVARARDLRRDGTLCAVKIFRFELGDRAWIRHRFEQEIAALEQLSHPNIVRITGHGAIDTGAPYLVMEFIHGQSLREHLKQGAMPRKQIGLFLRQLAGALAALHQASIYHRDLKPENLMIRSGADNEKEIVLIDFSIAIVKSPDQTFHGISRVAGTLDYMAPEQVIGYADASTDIYSLTKILLEMVTGLRWSEFLPEAKLDLPEQIRGYFREHPGLFQEDSIDLIVSGLAFDPAGRPKSALEFTRPIIRDLEDASFATSAGNEGG